MKNKIFFIIIFAVLLVTSYQLLITAPAHAIEVNVDFAEPGGITEDTNIASYVVRVYWFAVGAAGVLAVAVIVGGAIYYMTSAGSPDKQNDAKKYITSALWGVALLLSSYLILNTVNPQIVRLDTFTSEPDFCETGEDISSGCIPRPPVAISRVCKNQPIIVTNTDGSTSSIPEESGVNCLPACTAGQRPCGIGETPDNNQCAECAEVVNIPFCPISAFNNCPSPVKSGNDNSRDVPNCSKAGLFGSCEEEFKFETVNLKKGARFWQYPYYPSKKDPATSGRCVVHHYEDVKTETTNGTTTITKRELKKADLRGLALCARPE